jgi:hypothetical protein
LEGAKGREIILCGYGKRTPIAVKSIQPIFLFYNSFHLDVKYRGDGCENFIPHSLEDNNYLIFCFMI